MYSKKHIGIEILPRVLWVLKIILLIMAERYLGRGFSMDCDPLTVVISASFVIFGFIFFIWVIIYVFKALFTKKLIIKGPYKFIRHPMYISVYFILIGVALIFSSYLWFVILILYIPVWYKICRMEEKQMIELHDVEYLKYIYKTGMFWPKLK